MYREAYIERDHAVIARQAVSPSAAQQIKRAPPPPPATLLLLGRTQGPWCRCTSPIGHHRVTVGAHCRGTFTPAALHIRGPNAEFTLHGACALCCSLECFTEPSLKYCRPMPKRISPCKRSINTNQNVVW